MCALTSECAPESIKSNGLKPPMGGTFSPSTAEGTTIATATTAPIATPTDRDGYDSTSDPSARTNLVMKDGGHEFRSSRGFLVSLAGLLLTAPTQAAEDEDPAPDTGQTPPDSSLELGPRPCSGS